MLTGDEPEVRTEFAVKGSSERTRESDRIPGQRVWSVRDTRGILLRGEDRYAVERRGREVKVPVPDRQYK